ncbi:MAG: TlpA family protein disulfide reductase [candidate division Zixibacteria bacterium]|nr:TlpA family protein disulfide reductase [candidate division Zixibacteria bacterium]
MSTSKKGFGFQMLALVLIAGGVVAAWINVSKAPAEAGDSQIQTSGGNVEGVAANFSLPDLSGSTVRLSDFDGQVKIVDFWATWCPPCRKEIPHFQALHEKYGTQGLTVIGVALDDEGGSIVKPFAEQQGMTYTSVIGNADVARQYGGIEAIPTTFVLDRQNRIYRKYVGYRDYATFEEDVKTLLARQ